MELIYDWKSFQALFQVKKSTAVQASPSSPIQVVVEKNVIISAVSENEDLKDWVGASAEDLKARMGHRDLLFYEREKVDQWLEEASQLTHYYDQVQFLKKQARQEIQKRNGSNNEVRGRALISHSHFLLHVIQGRWAKVLPSNYGIFIRLDGMQGPCLFILVQRGRLAAFHIPDLSGMTAERRKHSGDVVKYLSSNYLVPVQGIFLSTSQWNEWSASSYPWKKIAKTLQTDRSCLGPFRWGVYFLILCKAYLGF